MITRNKKYSPEEVLKILVEQHRLCAELTMGIPEMKITGDMFINDWRRASDLREWKSLSEYLNKAWKVNISETEWKDVFEPQTKRKLIGLCELLSKYATKREYGKHKIMGMECLSAGLFLEIKSGLASRGVDIKNLRPSSKIEDYLTDYLSEVLEEVTQIGIPVIGRINASRRKKAKTSIIPRMNIFSQYHYIMEFRDIETFRDLIEKILLMNE